MFDTLKSLFNRTAPPPGADPELVDALTEIASPAIKLARKYQSRLSPYVRWAQDHAARFTAQWPEPLALDVPSWRQERILQLLFATPSRMGELIGQNPLLQNWFAQNPFIDTCYIIFTADSRQKMRYGMVEEGGQIRQDVPQQVLQFSNYRVNATADSLTSLLASGPRRILELIAMQASLRIATLEQDKAQLDAELLNARTMLRMAQAHTPEYAHQQSRINSLTGQLQQCNEARSPDALCELFITELAATPDILTLEKQTLLVDSMGIIASGLGDEQAMEISELVLQRSEPIRKLVMVLQVPRSLMQAPCAPSTFTGEARF
ncbi:hypothetical protein ABHF33_09070 [Chitinibacter sp. FCG-7]|uniref:Uncharacterized protein n=1 Tax=Chitinibacter mangrovi TaxID=3153927 RepID=A0AAU7F6B8_9NEIS